MILSNFTTPEFTGNMGIYCADGHVGCITLIKFQPIHDPSFPFTVLRWEPISHLPQNENGEHICPNISDTEDKSK